MRSGHLVSLAPDRKRGKHHRDIADGIVARAEPDRAHIGVAVLVAHQDEHAAEIGGERQHGDATHHLSAPDADDQQVVNGHRQHPQRHHAQARAFADGGK